MNYTVLIHSHSDYSYLWPIINDHIKCCNFKKVFAYDKIPENAVLPDFFDKYIKYDSSLLFTSRLVPVLEELKEDFVFIIYDVDIIINIDEEALQNYITIMDENNIDRVNIAVFDGVDTKYCKNKNFALCNLNSHLKQKSNHFVPIDCNPCIWNRLSFINLLKLFPNRKYNSFDVDERVINYCKNNIKCFGVQYTPNLRILYNRGLTYCDKLSFLHITVSGKFLVPFRAYYDYENALNKIVSKYGLDVNKIGTSHAHSACMYFDKLITI
jgi:hypothetical protein